MLGRSRACLLLSQEFCSGIAHWQSPRGLARSQLSTGVIWAPGLKGAAWWIFVLE